jgi:hypothetical protein
MREGFLIPIAVPGALKNPIRIPPANLNGLIRAERVDNDDFITPFQAVQARTDVFLFVEANDYSGDAALFCIYRSVHGCIIRS